MTLLNIPPYVGTENEYMADAIASHKICGDGSYTKKYQSLLEERMGH